MIICKDRGNFNFSAKNSEGRRSESTMEKRGKKMNSGDGKRERGLKARGPLRSISILDGHPRL